MVYYTQYPSPIGILTLTSDGEHLTGLWMEGQSQPTEMIPGDFPLFQIARAWLDAYFRGENPAIDHLPLSPVGTAFQHRVWEILLTVPYGETITYGQIAAMLDSSMAPQAVGGAVGRNPIGIIIPCHRCVGANRKLTGYAGGLTRKKWLLQHEGWLKEDEL